jgi:nucleoid DNA-binding protein
MVQKLNKRFNLKKEDIIKDISLEIGIPFSYASTIFNNLIDILISTLKSNIKLQIKNFGTFSLHHKNKRIGRNPKNKKRYDILARTIVNFKPSDKLKQKINKDV